MFSRDLEGGTPAAVALGCLEAGICSAQPEQVVKQHISVDGQYIRIRDAVYDTSDYPNIIVLGGGNAAGHVAVALEDVLGELLTDGIIITDNVVDLSHIQTYEGSHPLPNEAGLAGTRKLLKMAADAGMETLVLAVITGGGSALLPAPAQDIMLSDLRSTTDELLECGATITEINTVRKHLSQLKGGRLAETLAPATTVGLLISDVAGNDSSTVASGPLVPDETTFADAQGVVETYQLDVPARVRRHLERGTDGELRDTPGETASFFDNVDIHILADNRTAIEAAGEVARNRGYEPLILSSRVRGEAREVAKVHTAIAAEVRATGTPRPEPVVLISGGETTVTIRGDGVGGPNQEFALSAAIELADDSNYDGITCASVDTDGIDGATDACGAFVDAATVSRVRDAQAALTNNDAYRFLEDSNAILETGPTGTNVNDLRIIVVGDPESADAGRATDVDG